MACTDYAPAPFAMFDADYQRRLPLAAAIASCTTDNDEDLTIEVFADPTRAREFVEQKRAYLCGRAVDLKLADFPGFFYVDGGAWLVEPDDKATADKLAPILGGKAGAAQCTP